MITGLIAAADAAPEELSMIANILKAPPLPFIPAEQHGKPVVIALMVYAGGAEAGERAIAPIRALATPLADMVRPIRYPEMYAGPEPPPPAFGAGTNILVDGLPEREAETILEHLETATAPVAAVQLRVLGGAMARVPADATAFGHRGARLMVNIAAMYQQAEERTEHEAWASAPEDLAELSVEWSRELDEHADLAQGIELLERLARLAQGEAQVRRPQHVPSQRERPGGHEVIGRRSDNSLRRRSP